MPKLYKLILMLLCIALLLPGCSLSDVMSDELSNAISEELSTWIPDATPSATTKPTVTLSGDAALEVHYLDVGQADSTLILCEGQSMLIDGGNVDDATVICNYLDALDIDSLDVVVCTHAHEDHCGGLSGVLKHVSASTVYCSVTEYSSYAFSNFINAVNAQGISVTVPDAGDNFSLGDATCTFVGPVSDSDEPNNTSLVIRMEYGDTSFLFTGDAELEEETEILDAGYNVSCTVLKVGHHGSSTSTGYRWLREAAPEYAVISVGADNSYGHPHADPLSRLRDAEVTVYRTDLQGTVVCRSDGVNVSFSVGENPNADTLEGADKIGDYVNDTEQEDLEATSATETTNTVADSSKEVTYVLNTNSMKFHDPDCSSAASISEKNRQESTRTREELIEQGYSPCKRCDP